MFGFGKAKKQENQFIIAIKDFAETKKALDANTLSVPFDKAIYRDLIATAVNSADNTKDLGKFIKSQSKSKSEVKHYWEGLLAQGYTILSVNYDKKTPAIERLCDANKFKFVCRA